MCESDEQFSRGFVKSRNATVAQAAERALAWASMNSETRHNVNEPGRSQVIDEIEGSLLIRPRRYISSFDENL